MIMQRHILPSLSYVVIICLRGMYHIILKHKIIIFGYNAIYHCFETVSRCCILFQEQILSLYTSRDVSISPFTECVTLGRIDRVMLWYGQIYTVYYQDYLFKIATNLRYIS